MPPPVQLRPPAPEPDLALEALLSLGWKQRDAIAALGQVDRDQPIEDQVRAVLHANGHTPSSPARSRPRAQPEQPAAPARDLDDPYEAMLDAADRLDQAAEVYDQAVRDYHAAIARLGQT